MAILVAGCSRQPVVSSLDIYTQRLENLLGAELPVPEQRSVVPYPSRNVLLQPVPELSMKLREFYALQNCPVASLIAERNTALGRTQLPSTRYVYETRLIAGLDDCLSRIEQPDAIAQLTSWKRDKQEALPLVWANMVQTSDEMKRAFIASSTVLEKDNTSAVNDTVNAFRYLSGLSENSPSLDATELERHLQVLGSQAVPGKLHYAHVLLTNRLAPLTQWLQQHTQVLTCENRQHKQTVEYLSNVFNLFFVQDVQPYASQLNAAWYKLSPEYEKLLASPHTTPAYRTHLQRQFTQFNQYQTSMRQHVELWQHLFKRCGISPASLT